jgi:hypothetical protein
MSLGRDRSALLASVSKDPPLNHPRSFQFNRAYDLAADILELQAFNRDPAKQARFFGSLSLV